MDRKYKPLRPALASQGSDFEREGRGESPIAHKRKRAQVKIACDTCRAKKSACDGQRPVCAACVRRGSSCTFGGRSAETSDSSSSQTPHPTETDRHASASELLSLLTSATPEAAEELLADIKVYGDFSLALAHIRGRARPDQDEGISNLVPPDQGSVEFELMIRHPILYPAAVPLDLPLDPTQVFFHKSRNIDSGPETFRRAVSLFEIPSIENPEDQLQRSSVRRSLPSTPILADVRLEVVNFSNWTHVSIDNFEAANALSRYLETDHPILGLFDTDLFLEDLCSYETRFCSELFVNSLLSWACLDSSALTVSKADLSNDFFSEAIKQLSTDPEIDTITKLVALEFLSLTATFLGLGDKGRQYLGQAIAMGQRMGLLDEATQMVSDLTELRAACHCAWGLFSYATLHAFQCQQGDLGILQPPKLPLPTTPLSESTAPQIPQHSTVFLSLCQLWVLVHEILCRCFAKGPVLNAVRFDRDFVRVMLDRLLAFGNQFPMHLARGSKASHGTIILHILTHTTIVTLLRPLVLEHDARPLGLASFSALPAQEISTSSIHQLRRCITIYQHQFARKWPSVFWHTGCLFVANQAIRSTDSERERSLNLRLALNGYKSLYPRYPVTLLVAKGLLTMAAAAHLITTQEAYDFIRQLRSKGPSAVALDSPTETCFMVDLDVALTDQGSAHIDHLAQRFDDMVMFDEFTHGRIDLDGGLAIH